mmetsp:Transcript_45094/g.101345  ORF Transcript_45094/g.101345 Transcript_45094/m.101345 type:complete len:369 (+) Transcript_45094:19-1125(+)
MRRRLDVLAVVQQDGFVLQCETEKLRADRDAVLIAVHEHGHALQYATADLRADKEVVLAAVEPHGFPLQYASEELRSDRAFVLAAVRLNGSALQSVAEELRADRDVVLAAVQRSDHALQYATGALRADQEVVLASLRHSCFSLKHAAQDLRGNKDFMLAAGRINGFALQHATAQLREDRDFMLSAALDNSFSLCFASPSLWNDSEFKLALLRACRTEVWDPRPASHRGKHIPPTVRRHPNYLQWLRALVSDESFVEDAISSVEDEAVATKLLQGSGEKAYDRRDMYVVSCNALSGDQVCTVLLPPFWTIVQARRKIDTKLEQLQGAEDTSPGAIVLLHGTRQLSGKVCDWGLEPGGRINDVTLVRTLI